MNVTALDLLYNNTDDCNAMYVFILFVHRSYNNMMCIGPTKELETSDGSHGYKTLAKQFLCG